MSDKIIGIQSPQEYDERRQHQRRREDQVRSMEQCALLARERRARERRWHVLRASIEMYWRGYENQVDDWTYRQAVQEAEKILAEVEKREREQGKDEPK